MPKNSKGAIALVTGLVILLVGYFGAYSQYTKLSEAKTAFNVSKAANEKLVRAESDAVAFMAKYDTNRSQTQIADKALPLGDADVAILLGNMSTILGESGMNVTQMNVLDEGEVAVDENPGSIQSVDVDVQVSGSYEAFNNLLLRLQNNMRIMDLISMTVTLDEESSGSGTGSALKFTLRFRTYYQK